MFSSDCERRLGHAQRFAQLQSSGAPGVPQNAGSETQNNATESRRRKRDPLFDERVRNGARVLTPVLGPDTTRARASLRDTRPTNRQELPSRTSSSRTGRSAARRLQGAQLIINNLHHARPSVMLCGEGALTADNCRSVAPLLRRPCDNRVVGRPVEMGARTAVRSSSCSLSKAAASE
jgi:hypothetical protein